MNYAGHEKLRAEVAGLANNMCDLRATLNNMEHRYRFDGLRWLAGRTPDPPTLFRINALFMAAYNDILELDACFKDKEKNHVRNL
jgi:hypothetical protein